MCHETISIHSCTHEEITIDYCETQHSPTGSTWILDLPCSQCATNDISPFSDLLDSVARIRATVDEHIPHLIHRLDTSIGIYQWYDGQEGEIQELRGYSAQLELLRVEARVCEGVVRATCARRAELVSGISECEDAGVEVRGGVYEEFERVEMGLRGIAEQIAQGVDVLVIMRQAEAVVERLAGRARSFMADMSSTDAVTGAQEGEIIVERLAGRLMVSQPRASATEMPDVDAAAGAQEGEI